MIMSWQVDFHPEFLPEFEAFSETVQNEVAALIKVLSAFGPQLKKPHADTLKGSRFPNMKELRFEADNGVWPLAFAFDPKRKGILLVAGDKSGVASGRFYKGLIKRADARLAEHLRSLK
jgi:hypothetical protein